MSANPRLPGRSTATCAVVFDAHPPALITVVNAGVNVHACGPVDADAFPSITATPGLVTDEMVRPDVLVVVTADPTSLNVNPFAESVIPGVALTTDTVDPNTCAASVRLI